MKTKVVELDTYRDKPKVIRSPNLMPGMDPDQIISFEFLPCSLCTAPCKDGGNTCFALDILVDLASAVDVDKLLEQISYLRRCFTDVDYEVPKKE